MKELFIKIIDDSIALLKKGWCRRNFALDKNGWDVNVASPEACYWCLFGAFLAARIKHNIPGNDWNLFIGFASPLIPDRAGFTLFNDTQVTVDPIIAYLEKVKEKLEEPLVG